MSTWIFYGVAVKPVKCENLCQAVELLRAQLGKYRIEGPITIKLSRKQYFHIPPNRKIELRNVRPGAWQSS